MNEQEKDKISEEETEKFLEERPSVSRIVGEEPERKKVVEDWLKGFYKTNSRMPEGRNELDVHRVANRLEVPLDDLFKDENKEKAGILLRFPGKIKNYTSEEAEEALAKTIGNVAGNVKVVDIGHSTGTFLNNVVDKVREPGKLELLRVNPSVPKEHNPKKEVGKDKIMASYDVITDTPELDLNDSNVVIAKEVLKLFPEDKEEKAFNRLVSKMPEGSLLVTGSARELAEKENHPTNLGGIQMKFYIVKERDGEKQPVEVNPRKLAGLAELTKQEKDFKNLV